MARSDLLTVKEIDYEGYPSELRTVIRQANSTIDALSARVMAGEISPEEWHDRMRQIIERSHRLAMEAGAGEEAIGDLFDRTLGRQIRVQETFLDNFLSEFMTA
jgi:hypothetical protein